MFERIIIICPDLSCTAARNYPGCQSLAVAAISPRVVQALSLVRPELSPPRPGNYFLPRHQSALIPIMAIKNTADQKLNDKVLLTGIHIEQCVIL